MSKPAQMNFSDLSTLGRFQLGLGVAGGITSAFGALSAASAEKYKLSLIHISEPTRPT